MMNKTPAETDSIEIIAPSPSPAIGHDILESSHPQQHQQNNENELLIYPSSPNAIHYQQNPTTATLEVLLEDKEDYAEVKSSFEKDNANYDETRNNNDNDNDDTSFVLTSEEEDYLSVGHDKLSLIIERKHHGSSFHITKAESIIDELTALSPSIEQQQQQQQHNNTTVKIERRLTWWQLAAIVYFSVGGGPFGFEAGLTASGTSTGICLVSLAIMAVLWAMPQALYISELSTRFKRGYNEWVTSACGPIVGMAHSVVRVVFHLLTNGVYAALFIKYGIKFWNSLTPTSHSYITAFEDTSSSSSSSSTSPVIVESFWWQRLILLLMFEGIITTLNLLGLKMVGKTSVVLLLLVLTPFVIMFLWAIPQLKPAILINGPSHPVDWSLLISVLVFNLMGWDFIGNLSSQAIKPCKDVPIALGIAMVLLCLTYAIPTFVSSSLLLDPERIVSAGESLFSSAAGVLWGPFQYIISIAALIGVLGLGCTFLTTSTEAMAIATSYSFLPKIIGSRVPLTGAPWVTIVIEVICGGLAALFFNFDYIVQLMMWLFALSTLTIAITFIITRWHIRRKIQHRPTEELLSNQEFRVSLGFWGCTILACFTIGFSIFGIVIAKWIYSVIGLLVTLFSIIIAFIWYLWNKYKQPAT